MGRLASQLAHKNFKKNNFSEGKKYLLNFNKFINKI